MSAQENHLKTGGERIEVQNKIEVNNKVAQRCFEVFEEMKIRRKHKYIIFMIGTEEIEVERIGARKETYEDFKKILPYTQCRYAIYDHDYTTADGRPVSKLWFLSWFPDNSTTYHKMAYTSAKPVLAEKLQGIFPAQVSSLEEIDSLLGLEKEDDNDDDGFDF